MRKLRDWFVVVLTVFFILLTVSVTHSTPSQSLLPKQNLVETTPLISSEQPLAKTVLSELGTTEHYNLYLGNSVDIVTPTSINSSFREWLHEVLIQRAGWENVEDQYIAQLETSFSETELEELLTLAQHPLMQRFLQFEAQSYEDTGEERRALLEQVWQDYNSGLLNPPPPQGAQ